MRRSALPMRPIHRLSAVKVASLKRAGAATSACASRRADQMHGSFAMLSRARRVTQAMRYALT